MSILRSPEVIALMRSIKAAPDPQGMLNPAKVP
ncbi:FAD-linked oxidase C-terminal domain-containing protein [Paraburkholderia sp.]